MGIPISKGLFIWTLLLSITKQSFAEGAFELDLTGFTNDFGYNSDGNCCNGVLHEGYCTSTCRTFFRICLKQYQANISPDPPCTFGSITSPFLGENSFNIGNNPTFFNPIKLPFEFSWPGTFSLIIEAFHDTTMTGPEKDSPRELISRMMTQRSADVSETWTHDTYRDTNTALEYRYRVVCAESYYGPACSLTCNPRNDNFGHYTCDANGEKICMAGWQGPYCTEAICLPGCHGENGLCDHPNECKCKLGWQGMYCDTCIPYPGCDHGTCQRPWECTCDENWGGLFCNQDLIMCTTLSPCKNGATCYNTGEGEYTCSCAPGFNGTNCETKSNSCQYQPCLNGGECQDNGAGYICSCADGYKGRHCESNARSCAENPCENTGTCVPRYDGASYVCTCADGYTGENCEVEVNECDPSPCDHGNCVDELGGYRCVCWAGFQGRTCADEVYECSHSPCLHGGTCFDKVNDFTCQCVAGWTGPLCQDNVDDCLLLPCANGGSCHDLTNDFVCDCKPGYGGKDCRVDINECSPEPCQNGATCQNGENKYTCDCMSGYHGTNCELMIGQTAPTDTTHAPLTQPPHTRGNTLPPSTTAANTSPAASERQQPVIIKDESVISMQLTIYVCLGVGIPLIVLITVLVCLLLCRRRNQRANARAHDAHNDNVRNIEIASNMNNQSSKVQSENVHNTLHTHALKLTNEETPPSRTLKNINKNDLNADINKSKFYNKKDLNTEMGRSKDYLDTRESVRNTLDCNQLQVSPHTHSSEPSYGGVHQVKSYNRDTREPRDHRDPGTSSSIYYLDNKTVHLPYTDGSHLSFTEHESYTERKHSPYTEAVLATEV